jgi:predicted nucleic acid-binding protein
MADRLVVNASPLILLGRVGRLDLLTALADDVAVPQAVVQELRAGGDRDNLASTIEEAIWATLVGNETVPQMIAAWDLGHGETQVLAYARAHPGWKAVLDDAAARRCAASIEVSVVGTLGLVLRSKTHGVIDEARSLVEELRRAGLYLTDETAAKALKLVGE